MSHRSRPLNLFRFIIPAIMSGLLATSCSTRPPLTRDSSFNDFVLDAVDRFPEGGGYSTGMDAHVGLSQRGVTWNERKGGLEVSPRKARPSFCSSACYLAFLTALQQAEKKQAITPLPREAWKSMLVYHGQPDGAGVWGRFNANGPGAAKLVSDLKAGVNFTDFNKARAGDFMKIFWNEHIGARERGHLVVYLRSYNNRHHEEMVEYWSSNYGMGYSINSVKKETIKRVIFTRITHPERFAKAFDLPWEDPWLHSLLSKPASYSAVKSMCRIVD